MVGGATWFDQFGDSSYEAKLTASAELFDPASGRWTPVASMARARYDFHSTVLKDGRVLVLGSAFDRLTPFAGSPSVLSGASGATELYDPKTDSWSPGAPMSRPRPGHAMGLLPDGRVILAGGISTDASGSTTDWQALASAELYDPGLNAWHAIAPMLRPRAYFRGVVLSSGKFLVLGDKTVDKTPVTSELYDPDTNSWSDVAWPSELPTNTGLAGTLTDDGRVVAYGESSSSEYDPATNRWVASSAAAPPPSGQLVCMHGGRMLVFGDSNYEPFSLLSTAASAEWVDSGRPNFHHNGSEAAVVLRDGTVLVTGWGYSNTDANRETEIFRAK